MPGSMASFMDGVSSEPAFLARLNYMYYEGTTGIDRSLPIAGQTALNVNAKSNAIALTLFWTPEWKLSENWRYAMSMTIPWVFMDVTADISANTDSGTGTLRRNDKINGLGDLILMPLMFNYQFNKDLNTNFRLAIYAPTGSYKVGRLANTGKNFWTFEPTASIIYFGQKNGIEATLFFGADFNTENPDTRYQSGTQLHIDGTLAQHVPLWGGVIGGGVTGFWYHQVGNDSGEGANSGSFKARANGIGPVFSYIYKAGESLDILAEMKWLHEFDNKNRNRSVPLLDKGGLGEVLLENNF